MSPALKTQDKLGSLRHPLKTLDSDSMCWRFIQKHSVKVEITFKI